MIEPIPLSQRIGANSTALSALICVSLAAYVIYLGVNPIYQWDFHVFHAAPATLSTGANPYDISNPDLGYPFGLSYLYPPLALYAFEPLSYVPYRAASLIWFGLKVVALVSLIWLWHRRFEHLWMSWPTALFLAFGFNAPIIKDVAAGNIAIFEQLGIWSAFSLLIRNRPYLAGTILAITAQFKIMPIVLLGVFLFVGPKPRWKPFMVSLSLFIALFALNFILLPDMMMQYVDMFRTGTNSPLDERGPVNPSSLAFLLDGVEKVARRGIPVGGMHLAEIAFASWVGALALVFLWFVRKHSAVLQSEPRWAVYTVCVLFALTMPRMKDYSYAILLVPGLFVAKEIVVGRLRHASLVPLIGVAVLPHLQFAYSGISQWLLWYLPLFAAFCLLYYLIRMRHDEFWPREPSSLPAQN